MDCVRGFAGQGQYATLVHHSAGLSKVQRAFSSAKATASSAIAHLLPRSSPQQIWVNGRDGQRIHQCGSLADLARILERVLSVRERGLGIAKHHRANDR